MRGTAWWWGWALALVGCHPVVRVTPTAPPAALPTPQVDLRETALVYQTLLARARLRELEHHVDETIALMLAAATLEESLGEAYHEAHDRLVRAHDLVGWSDTAIVPTVPMLRLEAWLPGERMALFRTTVGNQLALVDARTGRVACTFEGSERFGQPQFSANGERLLARGFNPDFVAVWSVRTGQRLTTLPVASGTRVDLSPTGDRALVWSEAGTSEVWSVDTGQRIQTLSPLADLVDCRFSVNGAWVQRRRANGELLLTSLGEGARRGIRFAAFHAHPQPRDAQITLSTDSQWLITRGRATLRVWEVATGALRLDLADESNAVAGFAPDGRGVLFNLSDRLYTWDFATGQRSSTWTPFPIETRDARLFADGRIVSVVDRQTIVLNQWTTHAEEVLSNTPSRLELMPRNRSPEGRHITVGGRIVTQQTGRRMATFRFPRTRDDLPLGYALSPDGNEIALQYASRFDIWNVSLDRLLRTLPAVEGAHAASPFSSDAGSLPSTSQTPGLPSPDTFRHGPWTVERADWVPPGAEPDCIGGHVVHSAAFRWGNDPRVWVRLDGVHASGLQPWHFSRDHHRLVTLNDHLLSVWDLGGTPASMRRDLLDRTNLRVCRDSRAVIPVVLPRSGALQDSAYASDDECHAAVERPAPER